MEFLSGGELVQALPKVGSLEETTALLFTRSILMAVNHIHQIGIVHRDLKPENFLFGSGKAPEDLKLVDFGLSNKFSNKFEKLHSTVGTPFYIAPEVLKGNYDSKCDMWSVGVILFILLSGDIPFYGINVNEVFKKIETGAYVMLKNSWQSVNEEARHLVTRLLCLNTHDRLSASEALMHPAIFSIPRSLTFTFSILPHLKTYSSKTFMQKCFKSAVIRYMPFEIITEERKSFSGFDRNLKGVISAVEICDTFEDCGIEFSQHEVSELMESSGIRQKGKLYFSEFISCLISLQEVEESLLRLGFEFFDRDRKGFIELKAFVDSVGLLGKKIEIVEAEKIFKEISNFQVIGFDEFKEMIFE
jgi:calcium-dependent protein kinase